MVDLPETATFAEFARIAGFKPSYVTQLRKDNRLVLDSNQRVRVAESLARIAETKDPSKIGVAARHAAQRGQTPAASGNVASQGGDIIPELDDDEVENPNFQASRAKKEHYLALAAKRDYEMSIGKLLNAEDIAATVADAVVTLRTQLESLATMLAGPVATEPDESRCRALIAEYHEHALGELARSFRKLTPEAQA